MICLSVVVTEDLVRDVQNQRVVADNNRQYNEHFPITLSLPLRPLANVCQIRLHSDLIIASIKSIT